MATTTNFGWTTPDDTDLVKDGAAAIRTLGSAIDTSLVDLKGGTTGQVLSKTSNTDLDYSWTTPTDQTPLTTKGDLFGYSTADARIPIGTNGQVLTADSAETLGLKWADPAGGGKLLQAVSATTSTSTSINTSTLTDTTITATITPTSATSKILILITGQVLYTRATNLQGIKASLLRGATTILSWPTNEISYFEAIGASSVAHQLAPSISYLDSPATTSATTYKLQAAIQLTGNSGTSTWQAAGTTSNIILLEIGA